jgi:hypothetical protein
VLYRRNTAPTLAFVRAALPNFSLPVLSPSSSSELKACFSLGEVGGDISTSLASVGEASSSVWRRLEGGNRLSNAFICQHST